MPKGSVTPAPALAEEPGVEGGVLLEPRRSTRPGVSIRVFVGSRPSLFCLEHGQGSGLASGSRQVEVGLGWSRRNLGTPKSEVASVTVVYLHKPVCQSASEEHARWGRAASQLDPSPRRQGDTDSFQHCSTVPQSARAVI